jgi:hypothetical protein
VTPSVPAFSRSCSLLELRCGAWQRLAGGVVKRSDLNLARSSSGQVERSGLIQRASLKRAKSPSVDTTGTP